MPLAALVAAALSASAAAALAAARPAAAAAPACRSALAWPFNASSIWNAPLGAGARFAATGLFPADGSNASAPWSLGVDEMQFLVTRAEDPLVPWYDQGHWGTPHTFAAYCTVTGPLVRQVNLPANFSSMNFGGNNAVTLLLPASTTALTVQPVYVCGAGAPLLAKRPAPGQATVDIVRDDGRLGGHGGSGLSSLGGALRRGELLPGAPPVRHALQLEFFAHLFFYRPPGGDRAACFSWPATQCDSYAFACDTDPAHCYGGALEAMRPGALLAVPPAAAPALRAALRTEPARLLLDALAGYGAYVVDDAHWNATGIGAELGWATDFERAWGFFPNTTAAAGGVWYADFLALMRGLRVVVNNSPDSPGGGGAPLAPPPPPFC